jgi:hypothetical protein
MLSISDTIGKYETFRNEKVCFSNLTAAGGETQIIVTRPLPDEGLEQKWTDTTVQATSAGCESTAQIGASYVFGFQLHKEDGLGPDLTTRAQRWSCLRTDRDANVPRANCSATAYCNRRCVNFQLFAKSEIQATFHCNHCCVNLQLLPTKLLFEA